MKPIRILFPLALLVLAFVSGLGAQEPAKPSPGRGEIITPPAKGARPVDKLKAGDPAPDFTLPDLTGKKQVTLSSFRGKKPVVLIFGSIT
jgi:hypothetical protein